MMNTLINTFAAKLLEKTLNTFVSSDLNSQHKLGALEGKIFRLMIDSPKSCIDFHFHNRTIYLTWQTPTATIHATPAHTTLHIANAIDLLSLMLREPGAMGNVPVTGEMSVLQNMLDLSQNLNPQLGRKLSPWIGSVWAYRIENTLARGQSQLKMQTAHLAMHAKEWIQEDSALLAPRWQMTQITRRLQQLQTEIERLQMHLSADTQSVANDPPAQLNFNTKPSSQ